MSSGDNYFSAAILKWLIVYKKVWSRGNVIQSFRRAKWPNISAWQRCGDL